MTREQKLALIVGFALVLVVGILISDHLSPASMDEPIESLAFASPLGDLPPAVVIDERPTRYDRESSPDDHTPIEIPRPLQPRRDLDFTPTELTQGVSLIEPSSHIVLDNPAEPVRTAPKTRQVPAVGSGFNNYVVKDGDTLSKIAASLLGSSSRWKELAELNRDRVGDNGAVRSGVTLRIPTTARSRATMIPTQTAAKNKTYTVRGGDTLSQIAQSELGTMMRTDEILSLNLDKISDEDEIYEGLVLAMPAH